MVEINIQAHGFELDQKTRVHIVKYLHSLFGLKKYMVHKIIIKLFDEKGMRNNSDKCCRVQVHVKNQPTVITELRSLDIHTAIDLAIEHASLKLSHRVNGKKEIHKRLENKRNTLLYGQL